jgi:hypothetical protein
MAQQKNFNSYMKRASVNYVTALVCLVLFSCKGDQGFREIKTTTMTVQLMPLGTEGGSSLSFKVRLQPDHAGVIGNGQNSRDLWYHMDSCFYLKRTGRRQYALMVQPVNNGSRNIFEYLVQFEAAPADEGKGLQLVYHDKFVDQKDYIFKLSK